MYTTPQNNKSASDNELQRQPRRVSLWVKANTLLLTVNVLLAIATIVAIAHGSRRVSHHLGDYRDAAELLNSPTANPRMVGNVADFLADTTKTSLFGSTNGSVPVFLQNAILNYDFNGFATAVKKLAASVDQGMRGGGQIVNCAPHDCIAPEAAKLASIVESLAGVLETIPKINDLATGSAEAFSEGLFRIDTLLNWVKTQANADQWKAAAGACVEFVSRAQGITWSGTYTHADGTTKTWEALEDMESVLNFAQQLCTPLSKMSTA